MAYYYNFPTAEKDKILQEDTPESLKFYDSNLPLNTLGPCIQFDFSKYVLIEFLDVVTPEKDLWEKLEMLRNINVIHKRMMTDAHRVGCRRAIVIFRSPVEAQSAAKRLHRAKIENRFICAVVIQELLSDMCLFEKQIKRYGDKRPQHKLLYVSDLNRCREPAGLVRYLREKFSPFGTILSILVCEENDGYALGEGVIKFAYLSECFAAELAFDQFVIGRERLSVSTHHNILLAQCDLRARLREGMLRYNNLTEANLSQSRLLSEESSSEASRTRVSSGDTAEEEFPHHPAKMRCMTEEEQIAETLQDEEVSETPEDEEVAETPADNTGIPDAPAEEEFDDLPELNVAQAVASPKHGEYVVKSISAISESGAENLSNVSNANTTNSNSSNSSSSSESSDENKLPELPDGDGWTSKVIGWVSQVLDWQKNESKENVKDVSEVEGKQNVKETVPESDSLIGLMANHNRSTLNEAQILSSTSGSYLTPENLTPEGETLSNANPPDKHILQHISHYATNFGPSTSKNVKLSTRTPSSLSLSTDSSEIHNIAPRTDTTQMTGRGNAIDVEKSSNTNGNSSHANDVECSSQTNAETSSSDTNCVNRNFKEQPYEIHHVCLSGSDKRIIQSKQISNKGKKFQNPVRVNQAKVSLAKHKQDVYVITRCGRSVKSITSMSSRSSRSTRNNPEPQSDAYSKIQSFKSTANKTSSSDESVFAKRRKAFLEKKALKLKENIPRVSGAMHKLNLTEKPVQKTGDNPQIMTQHLQPFSGYQDEESGPLKLWLKKELKYSRNNRMTSSKQNRKGIVCATMEKHVLIAMGCSHTTCDHCYPEDTNLLLGLKRLSAAEDMLSK